MASSQVVPTTLGEHSLADPGRRFAAYIIDILICGGVYLAVGFTLRLLRVLGFWTPPEDMSLRSPLGMWAATGTEGHLLAIAGYFVAMGLFYFVFFEASAWQGSIGKRLLNVYVTDVAGKRLSLGRSFGRSLAKCVSIGFWVVGAVSIFTMSLSDQKEAVHDALAKTRVLRGRPAATGPLGAWHALAAFGTTYVCLVVSYTALFRSLH